MKKLAGVTYILLFIVSFFAYSAGLRLEQTRLILNSTKSNAAFTIVNDDLNPYLIQTSVTEQLEGAKSLYFAVTPPLFRLDANSKFSAHVLLKNERELPVDRESLFFLNTRAIPAPKHPNEQKNDAKRSFVTNIVIKVFYRPHQLAVPNNAVFQQVTLKKQGKQWVFNNPTPYYLTVVNLKYNQQNCRKSLILTPFSDTEITGLQGHISQASWQMINDFGGLSDIIIYPPVKSK
ncbi:fimbrial biogenesis chaperone [Providencia sp. PROV212]|uniref:fimbrial biogenesis chaperone n=1 Tax=Providencia sp. PROV212 TaxID=2949909 RepID=UPI002349F546|nr:molecular chaperone [Providencia sp. PROV212]